MAAVIAAALMAGSIAGSAVHAAPSQDRDAPGPAHTSNIVVGEAPPATFVLESIDGTAYDLGAAEGPLLLLFFRGTW
jgi:cytochrome oxidase Cu insertion factor (SCO1/SenC/PrrC family)